jgi:hypothetical protein
MVHFELWFTDPQTRGPVRAETSESLLELIFKASSWDTNRVQRKEEADRKLFTELSKNKLGRRKTKGV